MIAGNRRNVLKGVALPEARIVEAVDYSDNSRDQFRGYTKGEMIDYIAREPGGEVISGKPHEKEKFTRENGRWVLDEIDSEVSLDDLSSFRSRSEQA